MTNDLNNIPASVRDALEDISSSAMVGFDEDCLDSARNALPLIERLCQPNIVIVDLDDADSIYKLIAIIDAKAALAALKEK